MLDSWVTTNPWAGEASSNGVTSRLFKDGIASKLIVFFVVRKKKEEIKKGDKKIKEKNAGKESNDKSTKLGTSG
ncbi:hypothetical protein OUZ56_009225 [Daphnia magna]|uniref:Uncharacterized protein n=1 Tax=Daphnia magna TaxID=35525 RepID=A0ABR0AFC7_9CRUS|nr:hypothetical protein OUZ56_009225 [Daphnia magna]